MNTRTCKYCAHCTPDDDGFCWCDIQPAGEMTRLMNDCCDEWGPVTGEEDMQ